MWAPFRGCSRLKQSNGTIRLLSVCRPQKRFGFTSSIRPKRRVLSYRNKGKPLIATALCTAGAAALSPVAFVQLAEQDDGKTGEAHMLEQSREEVRAEVHEGSRGWARLYEQIYVFLYCYVYDPLATGLRFCRLVLIFAPVVLSVPVVWFGKAKESNGARARSGTLWWYRFLVNAMQRAGPAFIKVPFPFLSLCWGLLR